MVVVGGDVHVARLAPYTSVALRHRRAALPLLDDARIAGTGHRARAEIGVHVDGVAVDPAQPALGFRAEEAVLDPAAWWSRSNSRVTSASAPPRDSAIRQRSYAGLQAVGAVPDPVLALGLVSASRSMHGFPLRLRLAVFVQRGAPPQAALVLLVLPEVVVVLADLLDAGDLRVGIEDRADVGFELPERGVAASSASALRSARSPRPASFSPVTSSSQA